MGILLFVIAVCAMIGIIIASAYAIRIMNAPTKIVYIDPFGNDPNHHINTNGEKEIDKSHDYVLFEKS